MKVARVLGRVVLAKAHPAIRGARLLLAAPYELSELQAGTDPTADEVVVYDELGAGANSVIGLSEGREAAMPFHPERKPIDAYGACLVDRLSVEPSHRPAGEAPAP
jgi:ethanolamine utilization protein EutN